MSTWTLEFGAEGAQLHHTTRPGTLAQQRAEKVGRREEYGMGRPPFQKSSSCSPVGGVEGPALDVSQHAWELGPTLVVWRPCSRPIIGNDRTCGRGVPTHADEKLFGGRPSPKVMCLYPKRAAAGCPAL